MVTRVPTRMITTTGVTAGSYTAADITVNEAGQITSAASNSVVVSGGGGGPKITGVVVTDNAWTALDDTAVDVLGGYIKITGSGFNTGCLVYINQTLATATTYISSTEVRAQLPATAAGTYALYLVNSDGGVGLRLPGVTFSASPSWQTSSSLGEFYDGVAISLSLVASEATNYTLVSGSLPPGLTLNTSTGAITGTITGVTADTTYSFIVRATDAQNQDSPRTFTVTITVSDPYFKLTTLLLSGSALSTNTVLRDSSTNNFNLTAVGDTRASNFSPYGTGWSAYFDGITDFVSTPTGETNLTLGTSDFTIEGWFYIGAQVQTDPALFTSDPGIGLANTIMMQFGSVNLKPALFVNGVNLTASSTNNNLVQNQWNHVAVCRTGGSTYSFYINGVAVNNVASNSTSLTTNSWRVGYWTVGGNAFAGNISNFRIIKGTAIYSGATITVPTTPLTAVANTQLLILQSNRFIDSSTNNFAITRNGDVAIRSFNPFGITNTGVNGSMYFDGTGDYLTVAGNSGFAFGTGDFTIECWVNPDLINTATFDRICATSNYNGTGFDLTLNNGAAGLFLAGTSYGISSIPIKAWSHLVYTRSGTTVRGFLNGKLSSHTTGASQDISSTATLFIAHQGHAAGGSMLTGYLADLRIIKGSIPAAYQTASTTVGTQIFTPPTLALTAITNTQLLTLQYDQPHNNHTFLDASSNQFLLTRYGNATQGSFSPFSQNGWSVYFNGIAGNYLNISGGILGTSSNTFTIECWVYRLSNTYGMLFGDAVPTSYTNYWSFEVNSSNLLNFYWFDGGTKNVTGNTTIPINTWTHLALSVNNNVISLYVNGIQQTLSGTTTLTNRSGSNGYITIGQHGSPAVAYNGYISNLSFLSGTAKYSATFTPSSTKLLTNTINQQLLVCYGNNFNDFNTTNSAKSISVTGTPQVQSFSPFVPTTVYNPAVHGSSAYFDGSGDYLEMTYNPAFRFAASQDFCVEFWAYATSSLTTNYILSQVATNNWGFIFGVGSVTSGRMGVYYGNGASNVVQYLDDTTAFPLYQWIHVAWCRTSGTMSLFVDGTRRSTVANTNAINLTSDRGIRVGAHQDGAASTFWPGYIAGLRSIAGNSPYNATLTTLTLPTAPPTPTANTQILLNFADSAILDSTGRNAIETVADAKSSSVITKFTGGSMYFDGTGDYLAIPASELFTLRTADFTVECWIYFVNFNNQQFVGTLSTNSTTSWALYVQGSTLVFSNWNVTGASYATSNLATSTWYHIAATRQSGTFRLFVNGTVVNSNTPAAQDYSSTQTLYIGDDVAHTSTGAFTGYISDLRITKGYARYTSNFTPPTGPHRLK